MELLSDLNQLKAGRNRLRLAVTQSIGEHLLPDLLLAFADAFPDYRIDTRWDTAAASTPSCHRPVIWRLPRSSQSTRIPGTEMARRRTGTGVFPASSAR